MLAIVLPCELTDQSIAPEEERTQGLTMRAAAIQLTATDDVEANRATAERLVRGAAAAGAQLVVLPEKWTGLGSGAVLQAVAQPLDGPVMAWARALATELRIDLVAGSFSERVDGSPKLANTSVHVGPDGDVQGAYRKVHLFDVEVDGTVYRESEHESPGEELVVTTTAGGIEVGLTVCYDVRFPELYRALAVRGARVLTIPAAFTLPTTRDHWEVLVRARAIENACFVVAANQIGEHAPGLRSGGRSLIVDPWGVVLAQAPDRETFIVADLDLEGQARVRATLPVLSHRRPEVYA
jgi:predicted amidohydrolase